MGRREDDAPPGGGGAAGDSLRTVMACFPTGVTVVATLDAQGGPIGLTVSSFTSVSLDPPLVLVCIGRATTSHDRLIASGAFAVSVLSEHQVDVARRFASQPSEGRFDGISWRRAPSGNPVIEGATAWLDCLIEEVMGAGDHSIILGRAVAWGASEAPALLFHRGALTSVGE